jgi:hypothetical protein
MVPLGRKWTKDQGRTKDAGRTKNQALSTKDYGKASWTPTRTARGSPEMAIGMRPAS